MGEILVWNKERFRKKSVGEKRKRSGRDVIISKKLEENKPGIPRNTTKINPVWLRSQYLTHGKSMQEIADSLDCTLHKVVYWMSKYKIKVRTRSDATYLKRNPNGDPFKISLPKTVADFKLFGLGVGLYWGEGNKMNRNSIRLGNTDPDLIKLFIRFLTRFYKVQRTSLRFGLQIFSDIDPSQALEFWRKELRVNSLQFQKVIITPSRGEGTYRVKSKYGVLTVQLHNKKLRDVLVLELRKVGSKQNMPM